MRIPLLPKWIISDSSPCFYDTEKVTTLESIAKLHGATNGLIEDYNKFVDEMNTKITEFTGTTEAELEEFETALRQEFQDFIDAESVKYNALSVRIKSKCNLPEVTSNGGISFSDDTGHTVGWFPPIAPTESTKLYLHRVKATFSTSNFSSGDVCFEIVTNSPEEIDNGWFGTKYLPLIEGVDVPCSGSAYHESYGTCIFTKISYIHEYDEYYTTALEYFYVSNGTLQTSNEYGFYPDSVTDQVTEL